jgi:hypothetical protein
MLLALVTAAALAQTAPAADQGCPPEACVPHVLRRNIGFLATVGDGPLLVGAGTQAEWIRAGRVLALRVQGGVGFHDQTVGPAATGRVRWHQPLRQWQGGADLKTNGQYKARGGTERIPHARRRAMGPVLGVQAAGGPSLENFLRGERTGAAQATLGLGLWSRDSFQWVDFTKSKHARFETRMSVVGSAVVRLSPEDHIISGMGDRLLGGQLDLEIPLARPGRLTLVAHGGVVPVYGAEASIGLRTGRFR